MTRLERLVNLTAALIDAGRPLTREELHDRVGGYSPDPVAFRRNFERDKELLRQMGMPVTTSLIDPDWPDSPLGYRIPRDDYELPDAGLADDELAALRLATSAVQVGGADEATATALRKLAGAPAAGPVGGAGSNPVPADTAALPGGPEAAAVFGAVAARQRIEFTYRGSTRLVDPWRLSFRNGQWYLSGHDHTRDDARLFRLDRITGPVATTGGAAAFDRPDSAVAGPAPAWQIGDDAEVTVELLVDESQAIWAVEQLGADSVRSRRADGSIRFAVPVTNWPALRSFVLGLLDHAEVLGPPDLRAETIGWLEAVAG